MPSPRLALVALLALAGCAGSSTVADAPTGPLTPGDRRLDVAAVTAPSTRTFTVAMQRGDATQPFGTLTETIRRAPDGTVTRVQQLASPRGTQVDSLTASAILMPRSHDSVNPGRTITLRYSAGAATGTYTETGATPVAVNDPLSGPTFDSNVIDLVARAVPLEAGFTATVTTYERGSATATETLVPYTVRVVGPAEVDGGAVVVVEFEKADSGVTRLYVDPATRSLVRQESEVGPGVLFVMEPSQGN